MDDKMQTVLTSVLADYSSAHAQIGLQATVILPGGEVVNCAAGSADLKKATPLSFNHHLFIGSITKFFTAVLVMRVIEQGLLSLDDTLDKWYGYPYADQVTLRQLLNHTSGIPDYTQDLRFFARTIISPKVPWQPEQLIELLEGKTLEHKAGSKHQYSNSNYLLLGRILEKVTGRSYYVLLRERLFTPLELQDSYALDYPHDVSIANGYDETIINLGRRYMGGYRRSLESGAFAAGSILSTSTDVAYFTHALFNSEVIGKQSLQSMQTFVDAPDKFIHTQVGYGLGLRKLRIGGRDLIGHTGSIPGYSGIVMHNLQGGYTLAILSNLSIIDYQTLLEQIQARVLEALK